MFRLLAIIRENNSTFYDYRSNERVPIRSRIVLTMILATCLAILVRGDLSNFLDGVITVQAILIGFSFSVMFFLVSAGSISANVDDGSIEARLRREKLSQLSKEIFYNLSYFNLVAMACLVCALLLLMPEVSTFFVALLDSVKIGHQDEVKIAVEVTQAAGNLIVAWGFYFLVTESGFTFARTVGRVNYLFSQKIATTISKTA